MIQTNKIVSGKNLSYEIFGDGYEIYLGENRWIKQRGKYGKPMNKNKSYEENCLLQIEELTLETPEPSENLYGLTDEQYRGIVDNVIAQVQEGVRNND